MLDLSAKDLAFLTRAVRDGYDLDVVADLLEEGMSPANIADDAEQARRDSEAAAEDEYRLHGDWREDMEHMEHLEDIRSRGGDYWRNDAGEWMCG
jgi:hypothetical protein